MGISLWKQSALSCVLVGTLISMINTNMAGDPLVFMIPNFLLFTPFHHLATPVWKMIDPIERLLELKDEHGPTPVPEIMAKDYSFSKLREVSEGFRYPVVIRDFFSDTPAVKKWTQKGYLSEKIGNYKIRVQERGENSTYIAKTVPMLRFEDAFNELLENENSRKFMFFPFFKDRQEVLKDPLIQNMNQLTRDDLELDRIWEGFGDYERHSSLVGIQFSIGRAKKGAKKSTGTFDWHTEPGSNWFAQVSGHKTWYLMDPKYSSVMSPNHTAVGIRTIQTSTGQELQPHLHRLPVQYVRLNPGDLMYNPEWIWHTIKKDEGLSFGVAMREFNLTLSAMTSLHYLAVTATTHAFKNLRHIF